MLQEQDADIVWIKAAVSAVFKKKGKRYALAYFKEGKYSETDVTFDLEGWQGTSEPKVGQMVELAKVQLFIRGWRASLARPITLKEQA